MQKAAADAGADFADLYSPTANNTACHAADRGTGGLLENSKLETSGQPIPWYVHPHDKGRDLQAQHAATTIETALNHSPAPRTPRADMRHPPPKKAPGLRPGALPRRTSQYRQGHPPLRPAQQCRR
ncbi:hypothetical protein [Streptomyces sp. NPDC055060]